MAMHFLSSALPNIEHFTLQGLSKPVEDAAHHASGWDVFCWRLLLYQVHHPARVQEARAAYRALTSSTKRGIWNPSAARATLNAG